MLRSALCTVFLLPILATVTAFLLPLAFATTTFAFFALSTRVLVIYVELFGALISHHVRTHYRLSRPATTHHLKSLSGSSSTTKSRSSSGTSGSSLGLRMPGHSLYIHGSNISRDFEGIGGWRFPSNDAESDKQWLTMNSRLELPATPGTNAEQVGGRHHRRSRTSGDIALDGFGIQTLRGTPPEFQDEDPEGAPSEASDRPSPGRTKSMIALGDAAMNIGRVRSSRRRGSRGSLHGSTTAMSTVR